MSFRDRRYPTPAEVRELPLLVRQTVPKKWEDQNGHVNVSYYTSLYDLSGWPFFKLIGIDQRYFSERQMGFFDLENHVTYLSELHVGDRVAVFGRYIASNHKRIHGMLFVLNDDRDVLASTTEFVATSANLRKRKVDEIPADISAQIRSVLTEHNKLTWPSPVCGAMSI